MPGARLLGWLKRLHLSEGVSWGKFIPPNEGGQFAEVLSDATVVWPLLMVALLEQQSKSHPST